MKSTRVVSRSLKRGAAGGLGIILGVVCSDASLAVGDTAGHVFTVTRSTSGQSAQVAAAIPPAIPSNFTGITLAAPDALVPFATASDDHSCVRGQETRLAFADSVGGVLTAGDDDCFVVTVPAGNAASRLTAWTTGTTDTYGYLLDSGYGTIHENDDGPNQQEFNFQVQYNSASPGTYYVRVRGYDESTQGSYVIHADDHGNSREYAADRWGESTPDSMVNAGSITVPGNRDHFTFDVPTAGDYNVGTTGSTDTYGTLFDGAGIMLGGDDDGGPGTNFLITRRLDAGRYSAEVRGFGGSDTGPYELSVWAPSSDDHSCVRGQETRLAFADSVSGVLTAGDEDCFVVTVPAGNAVGRLTAWTTGTTDTRGNLLDSGHATIDRNDDGLFQSAGLNFQVQYNSASRGTYYVQVSGFDELTAGSYVIHADDHGNSKEYPTDRWREPRADSMVNAGSITAPYNRDYFAFYVPAAADYSVGTTGNTDTYGILYDDAGTSLGEDDDGGPNFNFLITRRLDAGRYFVDVQGFGGSDTGPYELSVWVPSSNGDATNLTSHAADDWQPAWSPDGRRIVFGSDRAGLAEIYVMNADGSGVTRLTNNSGDDRLPAWSPDGARIAFASNRGRNDEIYVMNADGSGVRRLTNNGYDPSWSPDGRRIAFMSDRDGDWEIYVMNADGSGVGHLTNDGYDPSWSPDGRRIGRPRRRALRRRPAGLDRRSPDGTAHLGDPGFRVGRPQHRPDAARRHPVVPDARLSGAAPGTLHRRRRQPDEPARDR